MSTASYPKMLYKNWKNMICLSLILLASSYCNAQSSLKDYDYPLYETQKNWVYRYVYKDDSTNIEYCKVTSIPETNSLSTISYDSELNIYDTFIETITESGAELTAYSDFELKEDGNWAEIKPRVVGRDV